MHWFVLLTKIPDLIPFAASGLMANGYGPMAGIRLGQFCTSSWRITTHSRVMRRLWNLPSAWDFVAALLSSPGLSALLATQRHADVAAQVFTKLLI
jgi:hypothetical protein